MTLLSVENLTVSIGDLPVLDSVSLTLEAGEVLGLVGESGSGKSMAALAIMDLLPEGARRSGRVSLRETVLSDLDERAMTALRGREIGMIFQEPMTALNPVMTIGDQVAETVRVHGRVSRAEAERRARDTLERVGLPATEFPLSRYPHELSGGQRQRVGLAIAIALRPKLLIADEPTTALDVTTQSQILDLLSSLVREDGMGLILISHDLAVVAQMAHRIAILKAGQVVESGATDRVLAARAHPYTRALLDAATPAPRARSNSQPQTPVLLAAQGVVRTYPLPRAGLMAPRRAFRAVDDVSLTLHEGESFGLVGESGCGKSTLARAVLGLDAIEGGRIALAGDPVRGPHATPAETRRKMQIVFQDPYASFNPRHKVGRLVAEPLHLLGGGAPPDGGTRAGAVAAALEAVGLSAQDAGKFIHEFSGGQRQRIAIARALIARPRLVVLDEPVSALDVSIRATILDLLADLSARFGLTMLLISHDLHVVRAITDRVAIMRAGRIIETGDTEKVFAHPRHAYTRQLIAATPTLAPLAPAPSQG